MGNECQFALERYRRCSNANHMLVVRVTTSSVYLTTSHEALPRKAENRVTFLEPRPWSGHWKPLSRQRLPEDRLLVRSGTAEGAHPLYDAKLNNW